MIWQLGHDYVTEWDAVLLVFSYVVLTRFIGYLALRYRK
jgi:hypothetical protein